MKESSRPKMLSDLDVKVLETVRDHLEPMCPKAEVTRYSDFATDAERNALLWKAARRSVIEDFNNAIYRINNKRTT